MGAIAGCVLADEKEIFDLGNKNTKEALEKRPI
jgi:hypothetical protein